jgi:hypothetical protein
MPPTFPSPPNIPLSLAIVSHGHVHPVLLHLAHRVQFAQHKLDQLALAVLGHHGQAVNHHKRIEPLVEAHLELLFNVGKVDVGLVELVVVERQVLVGWRHGCGCRVALVGSLARCNFRERASKFSVLPSSRASGVSRAVASSQPWNHLQLSHYG